MNGSLQYTSTRHRKQISYSPFFYVHINESNLTLTPGQIVAHSSMCLVKKSKKLVSNVVKPSTRNPAEKLWSDHKLDENEILNKNPNIRKLLYSMLDAHQDVFTTDTCSVGKTSWDTFKIDLIPNARPTGP